MIVALALLSRGVMDFGHALRVEEPRIGDARMSEDAENSLFGNLDTDKDGAISMNDIEHYVNATGGNQLDEKDEILYAAGISFDIIDVNHNSDVSPKEVHKYWAKMASLLSVEEVREWAAHAQQLPEAVVNKFVQKGVTGYDFPELMANDGALLESELGIRISSIRNRIMRGMRMKFMGLGRVPPKVKFGTASINTCQHTTIKWGLPEVDDTGDFFMPVHKFVLQRRIESMSASYEPIEWKTIYAGSDLEYVDTLSLDESVDGYSGNRRGRYYRVTAWNLIGRGEWKYLEEGATYMRCFSESDRKSSSNKTVLRNEDIANDSSSSNSVWIWVKMIIWDTPKLYDVISSVICTLVAFVTFLCYLFPTFFSIFVSKTKNNKNTKDTPPTLRRSVSSSPSPVTSEIKKQTQFKNIPFSLPAIKTALNRSKNANMVSVATSPIHACPDGSPNVKGKEIRPSLLASPRISRSSDNLSNISSSTITSTSSSSCYICQKRLKIWKLLAVRRHNICCKCHHHICMKCLFTDNNNNPPTCRKCVNTNINTGTVRMSTI